jgi:hypothetical protein
MNVEDKIGKKIDQVERYGRAKRIRERGRERESRESSSKQHTTGGWFPCTTETE